MAKALKAVGTAILVVGAVVATGGAALAMGAGVGLGGALSLASVTTLSVGGFSVSAGALTAVGSLVSSIGGALSQPRVSTPGQASEWVANPNAPAVFAAGRIGVGGNVIHSAAYGPNDRMYNGIVSVVSWAGPIDAWETFKAAEVAVSFDGSGEAITAPYQDNKMWLRRQNGAQPEASYLSGPSGLEGGATLTDWTSAHKLSGKAAFRLDLAENSKGSAYNGSEPSVIQVVRGLRVYDPRLDSTYPGGSGPHRLNDPTTWTYSANPILWALKWQLGLWEGENGGAPQLDVQVGGVGQRFETIDVPAYVEAANISTSHSWTCAAWPSTDDDKAQVTDAFLQAGGAYYIERGGKASCLHRAAPRASVATISADDTAGPIELNTGASYKDRKNTGVPTYLSEAAGWKMIPLGEVSSETWVEEDGGRQRSQPITFAYVSDATQAAQLMCLAVAHTREGISGRIPLRPYMQGIRPGDAFTITEAEFVLDGLKCLCLETNYDAATGVHTVTFVSETDGKYDYAYGLSPTPPAIPALTPVDPTYVTPPLPGDWTITVRPPAAGGGQLPSFDLTGEVSNATATAILVEYGPTDEGPWTQAYQGPPTVTTIPIEGLQPGETYYVAVSYQRGQNYSERYVYDPVTAPASVSDTFVDAGALAVLDEANTNEITPAAVTNALDVYTASALTLSTSAQNVQGVVFTATGHRVIVDFRFYLNIWHPAGGGETCTLVLKRGAITIWSITLAATGDDFLFGWQSVAVPDVPPAGSHVYQLTAQLSAGTGSVMTAQSRFMIVTEYKR